MPAPEEIHPDLPQDGYNEAPMALDGAPVLPEEPDDVLGPQSDDPDPEPGPEEGEFGAYDPAEVRPSPEVVEALHDDEGRPLPMFDERHVEDFEGLLFIGALSNSFKWLGHRFTVRTLTTDEMLAVTVLTKDYDQTMGAGLAYRTAMAACSIVTVDGKGLPVPFQAEDDTYEWARQRFDYVKGKWFQFTVDAVYEKYLELEQRTTQVVVAMGKASARSALRPG